MKCGPEYVLMGEYWSLDVLKINSRFHSRPMYCFCLATSSFSPLKGSCYPFFKSNNVADASY